MRDDAFCDGDRVVCGVYFVRYGEIVYDDASNDGGDGVYLFCDAYDDRQTHCV